LWRGGLGGGLEGGGGLGGGLCSGTWGCGVFVLVGVAVSIFFRLLCLRRGELIGGRVVFGRCEIGGMGEVRYAAGLRCEWFSNF